ncbi:MAG: DUF488 domain-containing protein [Methylocystaceae bacterium]|nr:MAG: DUF488 domain-containing protein [Methylocystaceae bacterium]
MIKIKRVYDPPSLDDGKRILVDRLWPRGLARARAAVDDWSKDLAPSNELRRWYGHRPERWETFKARYAEEISRVRKDELDRLRNLAGKEDVTLLYASREPIRNNAVALREIVESDA